MTKLTRRLPAVLMLTALLVGVTTACSDDASDGGASGSDRSTTSSSSADAGTGSSSTADDPAPAPVEEFEGSVDAFYEVPDPLEPGERGDIIRTQEVEAPDGQVGLRIMYHSTDVNDKDRAVTGLIYYPTDEAPEDGWPVMASAHGTSGIAPQCAISRSPRVPRSFGFEGVIVATDYIGLGPVGEVHSYLSATAEGNAMIDSVRAAHQIADAHAGDRWLAVGHSQGGHAALVTNDMAAADLPEYELLGTVAMAPGAQFADTYGDDTQIRIISTMILFGGVDENPDIDPADYIAPEAYEAAAKVVETGCVGEIIATMLPFASSPDFYIQDPRTTPATREWLESNDVAPVATETPILLVSGGRDFIVVPARTQALYERLCGMDQTVEFIYLPEADHGTEPEAADDQTTAWIADRLADKPAATTCP